MADDIKVFDITEYTIQAENIEANNIVIEINNQDEIEKYYNKEINTYVFWDDVKFNCDINVNSDIYAKNIDAIVIKAYNINAKNIKALGIKAHNIYAYDIDTGCIHANNIYASDIYANEIKAHDIAANYIYANVPLL